jgi:hypothetical protein
VVPRVALHHRGVSEIPLTEPDDRAAWSPRAATYAGFFGDSSAILHLAPRDGVTVGYVFTVLHDGTNDTFELAPRYADLLVLYFADSDAVTDRVTRLARFGYPGRPPENPYWDSAVRGFTVVDSDWCRLVLVAPGA